MLTGNAAGKITAADDIPPINFKMGVHGPAFLWYNNKIGFG